MELIIPMKEQWLKNRDDKEISTCLQMMVN